MSIRGAAVMVCLLVGCPGEGAPALDADDGSETGAGGTDGGLDDRGEGPSWPSDGEGPDDDDDDDDDDNDGEGPDDDDDDDDDDAGPIVDWTRRVLYFALIDRFSNGDASLDGAHGVVECNDADDPHAYQGGDLAGLQSRLDHVEDLGADALWITPLYRGVPFKQGSNCGFPGYWADFVEPYALELEPRFGDPDQFDALISAAHARGMPVMLDMVINHAGYGAAIVEQHPDWFADPATCGQGDPDIDCPLAGLPDFVQSIPEARGYLVDLHEQWVERFDIDAIRMDTVKHVRPEVFDEWNAAMRAVRPDLYIVGELLDEHDFGRFGMYLESGFDGLFNFPLRRGFIDTFALGQSTNVVASRMEETLATFGAEQTQRLVNLLDNHDVPRFLHEIPPDVPDDEAQQRYELAITALLTLPGIPQIYYGNEVGMYGGPDPDNRRFMPQWAFSEEGRAEPHDGFVPEPGRVYDHMQRLLSTRRAHRALRDGTYYELWRQGAPQNNNVWSYARVPLDDTEPAVVVAFNNGLLSTDGSVPVQVGAWLEDGTVVEDALGSGVSFAVEAGTLQLELGPQSAVVLVPQGD